MPQYRATEETFRDGVLYRIGDVLIADADPGEPFVLAAAYADSGATTVEPVATDPGFVVRGENGELVAQAVATRLLGRSLHELRAFKR
jgi:hypothetical protein